MKKYLVFLSLLIFLSRCEQNIKNEINSEVNHLATQTWSIDKIEKEIIAIKWNWFWTISCEKWVEKIIPKICNK